MVFAGDFYWKFDCSVNSFKSSFWNHTTFQNISLIQTIPLSELIIDVNKENIPKSFNWFLWTKVLFGMGTIIFLFRFIKELMKMRRLYQQSEKEIYDELIVCKIRQPHQV